MIKFRVTGIDYHGTRQKLSIIAASESAALAYYHTYMQLDGVKIKDILSIEEVKECQSSK